MYGYQPPPNNNKTRCRDMQRNGKGKEGRLIGSDELALYIFSRVSIFPRSSLLFPSHTALCKSNPGECFRPPLCRNQTNPTDRSSIIIINLLSSSSSPQSTIRVQERSQRSLGFQSNTSISKSVSWSINSINKSLSNFQKKKERIKKNREIKKTKRTSAPTHHSASSKPPTRTRPPAASTPSRSTPAGTARGGSPACATAARGRRCKWARAPGTVLSVSDPGG